MAKGGSGLSRPAGGGLTRPGAVNTAFVLDMQCKLRTCSIWCAIAARSISTGVAVANAPESVSEDGGYAATAHVQTYYKTARL